MKSILRILSLSIVTLTAIFAVSAQDLGSANKLFVNRAKPSSTSSKKTRTAPAKTTSKKHSSISHSRLARKRPSSKTTKLSAGSTDKTDRGQVPKTQQLVAPSKAIETRVTAADEARFEQLVEQGNAARDDRDYRRAESAYRSARLIKPQDARAIYGLGNLYSDQQRWEEAENAYRTALQLDTTSAMTYVALSYVLTQPLSVDNLSDRYAEAEKLARRATELSPKSALALDQLGVALEMRGEIGPLTEGIYRRAIALDPTFAPAYAHIGRLLRRRGMSDQANQAYRQAVERSSDVGMTLIVAEVMQSEQHYADSIPLLKQVLEADPKDPAALLMLGHALTVKGEYRNAETALKKALTAGSSGYEANTLLASLYMRQGALELAENALLQATRWVPSYENRELAGQFVALGRQYTKAGKSQQAQRSYSQAARLDPDRGMVSGRFREQQ